MRFWMRFCLYSFSLSAFCSGVSCVPPAAASIATLSAASSSGVFVASAAAFAVAASSAAFVVFLHLLLVLSWIPPRYLFPADCASAGLAPFSKVSTLERICSIAAIMFAIICGSTVIFAFSMAV
jgi:hypothetical protein